MPTLNTAEYSQYYELNGEPTDPPVFLITGLGGVGAEWGPLIQQFSDKYYVIVPDQRGTGRSTRTEDGYTTGQLADDMAALITYLGVGPVYLVGASTGAAIGQYMALDRPETVRSLALAGAFARFDAFARRGSDVRRRLVVGADRQARYSA